jgi:uncharacterized protein
MQISTIAPADRQVIESYGGGGFRVSGQRFSGGVIVGVSETRPWPVSEFAAVTLESLAVVFELDPRPDLLLIGCGSDMALPDPALRSALKDRGIALETMASGAACRTYNVLIGEERQVAAALIAVA